MLCVLNGEEIEIPESLIENEAVFRSVVSFDTWNSLDEAEKDHLMKYIPSLPEDYEEEGFDEHFKEDTVRAVLSSDKKFKNGNPVQDTFEKLKGGLLSPSVLKMKKKCRKLKIKNYKLKQKEYYKNLLQEIIVARQAILDKAYRRGPAYKFPKRVLNGSNPHPSSEKVHKKYEKIIRDVATECGDDGGSSDEDIPLSLPEFTTSKYNIPSKMHTSISAPTQDVSSAPNDTMNDGITTDDYSEMLDKHRTKRVLCESHPEIDTTNISLADVIMRCNSMKKAGKTKKTKKNKKGKLKKKLLTSKPAVAVVKDSAAKDENISKIPGKAAATEKAKKDSTKASAHGYPKMGSFFSLLGFFFEQECEKHCSQTQIEDKVSQWQNHKSSDVCGWKALYPTWVPLVRYAIDYMVGQGTASLLHEFIPLLIPGEDKEWTWAGPEHNNDDVILPLCHHWLETLSQTMTTDPLTEDKDRNTIDTTRTSYIVRHSSDEEKSMFRGQEKERYTNPHLPFIYTTHGYQSIVGPVKGVFSAKDLSASKAREHVMLISDRPAYVTILCLVRDAVARLPNGEGTRADVCTLLKDSQFLNPDATDSQVHGVVSGALDRLHAEKDPCVKFDAARKLWIYLHRTRSVEEFEKLHEASAAAALAKKQLSQSKQKAAKQKKVANELNEILQTPNPKKEISVKNKKVVPSKLNDVEKPDENTTPKSSELPKNKEEPKKKAAKRKRSVNDSVTPKVPKLNELNIIKPDVIEEIQLSLENEALMATQSILSDDESSDIFGGRQDSDIFGENQGHSDLLGIDSFNNPSDNLPSVSMETPVEISLEVESAYNSGRIDPLHDASYRKSSSSDDLNFPTSSIDHRLSSSSTDSSSSITSKQNLASTEERVLSVPRSLNKVEQVGKQQLQKQISMDQLSEMLGDNPLLNYGTGERLASSLQQSNATSGISQNLPKQSDMIQNNTSISSQSNEQTLYAQTHLPQFRQQQLIKLQKQQQQARTSQGSTDFKQVNPQQRRLSATQVLLTGHGNQDYLQQQVQLRQLLQQQQRQQQQQQQGIMFQQQRNLKQTAQKQTHLMSIGKQKRSSESKQVHVLTTNRSQQQRGKKKQGQPLLSLSVGNTAGTSLQTLSQFITSRNPISPKTNASPTSITFGNQTVENQVKTGGEKPSLSLNPQNPYQIQQASKMAHGNVNTKVPATHSQPFQSTKGIVGQIRLQTPSLSDGAQIRLQTPSLSDGASYQFIDVKGSRGNQIIAAQPPFAYNQKVNKPTAVCKASPVQTFSLNQLMAVARTRTPDSTAAAGTKIQTIPIPLTQATHTSASLSTPPVTSIQALLHVMQKPASPVAVTKMSAANTQLLIQRQSSTGTDQNAAKIVRLPKAVFQGKPGSSALPQSPMLTFQKMDNMGVGSFLVGHQGISYPASSAFTLQQGNRPTVAPLKISLPRTNFTGVPSPVRLSSAGASPVRLSTPGIRLPSPGIRIPSSVISTLSNKPQIFSSLHRDSNKDDRETQQ